MNIFTLTEKKLLTGDVFLLKFKTEKKLDFDYGQFITFLLPGAGGRAYSIAWTDGKEFHFIIKRLEEGKGGSKVICDLEIGSDIKGVGPVGKFVLQKNNAKKLFIGTGTGFAPLYFMATAEHDNSENTFVFGVRTQKDLFYIDELNSLSLSTHYYLSQDTHTEYNTGRVTAYVEKENIQNFDEVYICGSPAMCEEVISKLENMNFPKDKIYSEEY